MGTHLAEVRGEEERLEQRVHVACRSLVLETDVAGELFRIVAVQAEDGNIRSQDHVICYSTTERRGDVLDEVVPEHTCRVFQYPHKGRDIHLISLNRRASVTLLRRVKLPEVGKASETPIALLVDEPVMSICRVKNEKISDLTTSTRSAGVG